jgi:hypothetical protein
MTQPILTAEEILAWNEKTAEAGENSSPITPNSLPNPATSQEQRPSRNSSSTLSPRNSATPNASPVSPPPTTPTSLSSPSTPSTSPTTRP